AFFWAGCGGDQKPFPRRTVALAAGDGRQLADGVEAVLKKPLTPVTGKLTAADDEVDLPHCELPTRGQLLKETSDKNRAIATRAKQLLQELERSGTLRGTYPYPVQVWQLGPGLTFVALGGEVVVDYSLRLKKELGAGRTWIASYTNDVMAYIPSL